jgi:uncharacterized membrane protein
MRAFHLAAGPVSGAAGRRWGALLVAFAATGWMTAIVTAPRAAADVTRPASRSFAAVAYASGARVCHQQPARSFHSDGRSWPVCARCTGLYAGAVAGAWLAVLATAGRRSGRASLRAERFRWPLLAALAPTAATWILEFAGLAAFSNAVRFSIAAPLGAVAAWIVTSLVAGRVE